MGWLKKAIVGRWLGKWLLRGGPWTIAAKLAGVALYGAWKWRREAKRVEDERRSREIPADYEVIRHEGELAAGREGPPSKEHAPGRQGTTEGRATGSIRSDHRSQTTVDRAGGTTA